MQNSSKVSRPIHNFLPEQQAAFLQTRSVENLAVNFVENLSQNIINRVENKNSAWDKLYNFFVENEIMSVTGEWIKTNPPPLPILGEAQKERLKQVLETPYQIFYDPGYGEPKAAQITLKELINDLGHSEVELVGSGVFWVLGEEFFIQFLKDLGVSEKLITDELLEVVRKRPQDFDFRFSVPDADPEKMHETTLPLFKFLAKKFDLPLGVVMSAHRKKKFSTSAQDIDQYGSASLQLYHSEQAVKPQDVNTSLPESETENEEQAEKQEPEKPRPVEAFKVDFLFVKELNRRHLNKQDAASLKFSLPLDGSCTLKSDLPEVRTALAHRILRVLDADEAQTVNKKGLPRALAATTKGHYAIKRRYFSNLFEILKKNKKLNTIASGVKTQVSIHSTGHPLSLLAAAFNTNTFLGPRTAKPIFDNLPSDALDGDTLLNVISRHIGDGVNSADLHHLLAVHSYLGLGKDITILQKTQANLIEMQSSFGTDAPPLSLFLYDRLANSLEKLAAAKDWKGLESLSTMLIKEAHDEEGLPLPTGIRQGIRQLFKVDNPAAKKLAFSLLCKWQRQHPNDLVIESLLSRFLRLCKTVSDEDRQQLANLLADTLEKAPGSCPPENMAWFTEKLKALCALTKAPERTEIAKALYRSRSERLCSAAMKIVLENPADKAEIKCALTLLKSTAKKQPVETLALFFKHIPPLSLHPSLTFELFVELLEENEGKSLAWDIKSIQIYVQNVLNCSLANESSEGIKRLVNVLNRVDPLSAQIIVNRSLKNTNQAEKNWFAVELLNAFKKTVQNDGNPIALKEEFLNLLESPHLSGNQETFYDIFHILFNKLIALNNQGIVAAQSLLTAKASCDLHKNYTDQYAQYLNTASTELDSNTKPEASFLIIMAENTSDLNPTSVSFQENVTALEALLNNAYEMRTSFTPNQKHFLQNALIKIISNIKEENSASLIKLLYQCKIHQVDLNLSAESTESLHATLVKACKPSNELELNKYEAVHTLLTAHQKKGTKLKLNKAIAPSFVEAALNLKMPLKGMEWLKKHPAPQEEGKKLLQCLADSGYTQQQEELLLYENGRLFSEDTLRNVWLRRIRSLKQNDPAKAAEICLKQHAIINAHGSDKKRLVLLNQLITQLLETEQPPEIALNILRTYNIPRAALWDNTLKKIAASPSKARIELAWSSIKSSYPQAPYEIRILLLRAFSKVDFVDPSLNDFLEPAIFEASAYYRQDPKEQTEIVTLFLGNAVKCLKAGAFSSTFENLYNFREKYLPDFKIETLHAAWYCPANTAKALEHLHSLKELDTTGKEYRLYPSQEFIHFMEKQVISTKNFGLYGFCLKLMSKSEYKALATPNTHDTVLNGMLLPSLSEGRQQQDYRLLVNALCCYSVNSASYIKNIDAEGRIYPQVMQALPSLLNSGHSLSKSYYYEFIELYGEIVKNFKPQVPKIKKGKRNATNPHEWNYHHTFINALFDVKTDESRCLLKVAEVMKSHFQSIFSVCEQQKVATLDLVDRYVYTSMFSKKAGYENKILHSKHYDDSALIIQWAKSYRLFNPSSLIDLQYKVFLKSMVEEPAKYNDKDKEAAALHVINKLLENPSHYSLQRALVTIDNTLSLVKQSPEKALANITNLISLIEKYPLPLSTKLGWSFHTMNSLVKNIQIQEENNKKIPSTKKMVDTWKNEAVNIFTYYFQMLNRFSTEHADNENAQSEICIHAMDSLEAIHSIKDALHNQPGYSSLDMLAFQIYLAFWCNAPNHTPSAQALILSVIQTIIDSIPEDPSQHTNLDNCLKLIMNTAENNMGHDAVELLMQVYFIASQSPALEANESLNKEFLLCIENALAIHNATSDTPIPKIGVISENIEQG